MANQEQDNQIRITHYINPHNFWFKQESAYLFNGEEQNFQQELNTFCDETFGRGNISSGIYTPREVGETVAVYYFQLARWIRAQVDGIYPDLSGQVQCNLWAIDEGVPVKTSSRYIKPLPERFAKMPTVVKRGGLVNVLPAECRYDYLQGCNVTQIVADWSPGVVRVFEGCIEEAVSISFSNLQHYEVTGIDTYFGEMKITSHQNVTNNATDLLKKAGGKMVMLVHQQEFYDHLPRLRTLDMQRFEDNERFENMKFHTNTFRPEYSARSKPRHPTRVCSYENQAIEQAREKVLDWDERNKRNTSVIDFNPFTQKAPTPSNTVEKRNRPTTCDYSQLVNESVSDDDETTPQVEIKLPAYQPKKPPQENTNLPTPAPYQRPHTRVYDVDVSEVQIALDAIKLRRQAAANYGKTEPPKNAPVKQGPPCPVNIFPAGFDMNNMRLPSAATSEVGDAPVRKRDSTASLFNPQRKPVTKITAESKLRRASRHHRGTRGHNLNSSSSSSALDEEVVQKLTIQHFPDEDEQW